ncbi:MAG: amidophosphoribosyltransferase [Candidatus Saccharibacteria bacterium]|nr:amidophosphoribosyltransferase [Candidatus Saccharibacteria bacterium]
MSYEIGPVEASAHNGPLELAQNRPETDRVQDECGVFLVYAPGMPVGAIAYEAGVAGEHRGHSGSGIAYNDSMRQTIVVEKGIGRMHEAIPHMKPVNGMTPAEYVNADSAIGHNRYNTNEDDDLTGVHPHKGLRTNFAIAHNGQFNEKRLAHVARKFDIDATGSKGDSALFAEIVDRQLADTEASREITADVLGQTMVTLFARMEGAFCVTMLYKDMKLVARDWHGVHPLSIGTLADNRGVAAASETVMLEHLDFEQVPYEDESGATKFADNIRDVEPGEVIVIDEFGTHRSFWIPRVVEPKFCLYEHVYTSHEKSTVNGSPDWLARYNMGKELALAVPLKADLVVGVPKSGLPPAHGYADTLDIPYVPVLAKNPEVANLRTFLLRDKERAEVLKKKFLINHDVLTEFLRTKFDFEEGTDQDAMLEALQDMEVVVIDDSNIKGNVGRRTVELLRTLNFKKISVLLASPPYKKPCNLGMDTSRESELIAREGQSLEQIAHDLGADLVAYNSFEAVERAIDDAKNQAEVANGKSTPSLIGKFCGKCSGLEVEFNPVHHLSNQSDKIGEIVLSNL